MFGGDKVAVTLEAENRFAGILIDRFGKEIFITKVDDGHFRTAVDVVPSELFISWIMSFGNGIRIVAPDSVVESVRQLLVTLKETYL